MPDITKIVKVTTKAPGQRPPEPMLCADCEKVVTYDPDRPQRELADSVFLHNTAGFAICGACATNRVITSLIRDSKALTVG